MEKKTTKKPIKNHKNASKTPVRIAALFSDPKRATRIVILAFIGVLLLTTAVLVLISPEKEQVGIAQAAPKPTPTPTPEPAERIVRVTNSPTPVAVSIEAEAPEGAVNVVVKNRALFMMESEEAAAALVSDYVSACAVDGLAPNEWLLRAYLESEVSLTRADGTVEMLTYDAAMIRLLANPSLIPVARTVAKCETVRQDIATETASNAQLPSGTRIFTTWGSSETWLVYSETMYSGGVAYSATETNRFQLGGAMTPRRVELGAYVSENPNGEPRRGEGQDGRKPEELSLLTPLSGSYISYFGMRRGQMHYGVDIQNHAGTRILAPEDGVVVFVGERGDYGTVIEILHDEAGFVSRLAHVNGPMVELWQRVRRGDQIGNLADEVNGGKPYLHYELMIDGIPYDPTPYLHRK